MNAIKRNLHLILFTILLTFLLAFGIYKLDETHIQFRVHCKDGTEMIRLWERQEDDYHVFVPAYASLDEIIPEISSRHRIALDGVPLYNGMPCNAFQYDTPYMLTIGRDYAGTLQFHHSANTATLYIHTASGSMEQIHTDKNHSESASIALYSSDGTLAHTDRLSKLKGRGNASWNLEKKPYNLTLSVPADLLGMDESTNWILLANAFDATNLNNKLVLDLAGQTGLSWSADTRYIDLYLNGEYSGLYLLSEKTEVGDHRLDIHTAEGAFLCKNDLEDRYDSLRNPFTTVNGRTVEITAPEQLSSAEKARIEALVNEMEQRILSGSDLSNEPSFDLDSWVRKYLLDEISGNIDSDLASSYFFYDGDRFYAGPVWDYDMVFGNDARNQYPRAFIAKNYSKAPSYVSPYYHALCENPSFYRRMTQLYQEEFLPLLEDLVDIRLPALIAQISDASAMNHLRWEAMYNTMYTQEISVAQTADSLQAYLKERIAFLSSAWLDGVSYHTVQFGYTSWNPYVNRAVEHGNQVEIPQADTVWLDVKTGEPFDFQRPITEDVILLSSVDIFYYEHHDDTPKPISGKRIILLSFLLLASSFCILLYTDLSRVRRRSKAAAQAPSQQDLSNLP